MNYDPYKPPLANYHVKKEDAWEAWKKAPGESTLKPVLDSLEPTIDSAVKSFGSGNDQLKTRARILAVQALDSYDPKKGAALNTHVFNNLRRLQRVEAERRQAVHVPENVRLDGLAVQNFINRYRDEQGGTEPSALTIADSLAITPARVRKALGWGEIPESTLANEKGDSGLTKKRTPEDMWADYVYHDLDDANRVIFAHVTGYQGAPRLAKNEIAAKLGISAAAVSQRVNTITKRLGELYSK